ncbi:MAG: hypothetical protein ACRC9T_06690 [Vibrionaceae bacterium]
MKIVFVDAENVGVKALEKIQATIIDKVFVFSKVESVRRICEKSLFYCLSDYPSGANQADFYIIAYLVRVISMLDAKLLAVMNLELYSNDENLISAFHFQCEQFGAKVQIMRTKSSKENTELHPITTNVIKISAAQTPSPQDKLFSALSSPRALDADLQLHLGLSQPDFTRAITELIKLQKIQRSAESKQKWVQC